MEEDIITLPRSVYESEKKMRFFGDSSFDYKYNRRNIFIGISISNKKITPKMALNYLRWAVANTKEKVAIVIADELNIINYKIFDGYGDIKAANRAKRVGDFFEGIFKDAIKKLSFENQKSCTIYRWSDIKSNKHYQKVKEFLENQYGEDGEFKSAVLYFIKKYMRKKGKIITDFRKVDSLTSYILGELPTLLEGIKVGGIYYGLCVYPTYFSSGMSQFVMDIHEEELGIGTKIKPIIEKKAILVEAWLD